MDDDIIIERCYARIGLMGNPSDGFNGKTLSFLISNFSAEIKLVPNTISNKIQLVPNLISDRYEYDNLESLLLHTKINGYYGGLRLIQATMKVFTHICLIAGLTDIINNNKGYTIEYNTTIPRMVGLSGSSAIIIATFKALMKFYNLTLEEMKIAFEQFPQLILDIEKQELDIAAGLQDRVIQTYGGLVHMDFSNTSKLPSNDYSNADAAIGKYTSLDPKLLPVLYLAYNTQFGGDSGKVHSTVKERWLNKDPQLIEGMMQLGKYADDAVDSLINNDSERLASLMEMNFAMRRKLYGDSVVGLKNIAMIDLAKSFGLSAKFTGSGGALICIRKSSKLPFDNKEEIEIRSKFQENGFEFIKVSIPN